MSDSFISIQPKSERIRKLIRYYYFHKSDSPSLDKTIIYYPHLVTGINIYRNSKIIWDENGRTYVPTKQKEPTITLTINHTKSKIVRMRGAFNKIGIVLNPLGINHFISQNLSELYEGRITDFGVFSPDIVELSNIIYHSDDSETNRDLLDDFFELRYVGFDDTRLIKAISLLNDTEVLPKTSELAANVGVSRETLLRLFKKHLCCSVEQYKALIRFRKALDVYQKSIGQIKLTQVAATSEYYDQSDFIRHFKTVTGFNPKPFFSNLRHISSEDTYWTLVD